MQKLYDIKTKNTKETAEAKIAQVEIYRGLLGGVQSRAIRIASDIRASMQARENYIEKLQEQGY